jgi:hypothetical protein
MRYEIYDMEQFCYSANVMILYIKKCDTQQIGPAFIPSHLLGFKFVRHGLMTARQQNFVRECP